MNEAVAAQAALQAVAQPAGAVLTSGYLFWIITLVVGLGNFALRAIFVYAMERIPITGTLRTILSYIPAAVLAALVAPAIILHQGNLTLPLDWLSGNERTIAALAALLVSFWKRNMLLTIVTGMGILYLLEYAFG